MNLREAKDILLLYRPGTSDDADPELAEALALANSDPDLGAWFARHCAFQEAMRAKLRSVPVPADLRDRLLAERKTLRPAFWQRPPVWLAAAAMLALMIGIAAVMMRPHTPDRFTDYKQRMVANVLRSYHMDLATNDMAQVRAFMARKGAPADFEIPGGLDRLQLAGGGFLQWRGQPVSMVCFDRGGGTMLYLFVLRRDVVPDAPSTLPVPERVNKLQTASWSRGENTYLLAGPEEADFLKRCE